MPQVTRELRRLRCNACSGTGNNQPSIQQQCACCQGKGWTADAGGHEAICADCKGFRTVIVSNPCSSCDGKGYHVALIELIQEEREREVTCFRCKGSGTRTIVRRVAQAECERCGGTGIDFALTARGVALVDATCKDCDGGRSDTGKKRDTVECDECRGFGEITEIYMATQARFVDPSDSSSSTFPGQVRLAAPRDVGPPREF
jgi:DnaJ-class molecular chaperone